MVASTDVAKLLDICAVFSGVDLVITQKVMRNMLEAQPKFVNDLTQAMPMLADALTESSGRLRDMAQQGVPLSQQAVSDTSLYVCDCAFTLTALLRVFGPVADVCWRQGMMHVLASSHLNLVDATRRGSGLRNSGLIEHGLLKRLRGACVDAALSLVLALLGGVGGGGNKKYQGQPAAEGVAAELVHVAHGDGSQWILLRDLEFRHGLSSRLAQAARKKETDGDSVLAKALRVLKESASRKRDRAMPLRGAGKGGGIGGVVGGLAVGAGVGSVDMEKVHQVRDVLGDMFGEGFVAAMLKESDGSVERVIQVSCVFPRTVPCCSP